MADEEQENRSEPPEDDAGPDEPEERASEWSWWLLVIPILALLTATVVGLYGVEIWNVNDLDESVEIVHVVIAGVIVLTILLVVEIALLVGGGGQPAQLEDAPEPAPGPETPAAREIPGDEPPEIEALATDDEVDGKDVLEVARPPKWAVDAGVYATTYVDVSDTNVLRLEEIVALRP